MNPLDEVKVAINKAAAVAQKVVNRAPSAGELHKVPSAEKMKKVPSGGEIQQPLARAIQEKVDEPGWGQPEKAEENQAFKSYLNEITTFLNNDANESSSDDEIADEPINFENIHVPRVIDREDDVLEQEDAGVV